MVKIDYGIFVVLKNKFLYEKLFLIYYIYYNIFYIMLLLILEKDFGIVNFFGNNLKNLFFEIMRWDKFEKFDFSKNYGLRRIKVNDNISLF